MKLIRERCCCFTGHRVLSQGERDALEPLLEQEILGLERQGVDTFLAGGALGFDTLAARCVLRLREENPWLHLVLVLPCLDQDRLWRAEDIALYREMMKQADEVIYTDDLYSREAMLRRNRYLVERSSVCLCYLRQTRRGGTAYTVGVARSAGVEVINLAERFDVAGAFGQESLFAQPRPDPEFGED